MVPIFPSTCLIYLCTPYTSIHSRFCPSIKIRVLLVLVEISLFYFLKMPKNISFPYFVVGSFSGKNLGKIMLKINFNARTNVQLCFGTTQGKSVIVSRQWQKTQNGTLVYFRSLMFPRVKRLKELRNYKRKLFLCPPQK